MPPLECCAIAQVLTLLRLSIDRFVLACLIALLIIAIERLGPARKAYDVGLAKVPGAVCWAARAHSTAEVDQPLGHEGH